MINTSKTNSGDWIRCSDTSTPDLFTTNRAYQVTDVTYDFVKIICDTGEKASINKNSPDFFYLCSGDAVHYVYDNHGLILETSNFNEARKAIMQLGYYWASDRNSTGGFNLKVV